MAAAGASAREAALRQQALAEAHEQAAAEARDAAARYGLAGTTESRVGSVLAPLAAVGYTLLPDRAWPGSRRMWRPGRPHRRRPLGVDIVDTKAWREVSIRGGRIFRGQADVSDDLANMAHLAHNTEALLAEVGLGELEVHAVAVLAGRRGKALALGSSVAVLAQLALRGPFDLRDQRNIMIVLDSNRIRFLRFCGSYRLSAHDSRSSSPCGRAPSL